MSQIECDARFTLIQGLHGFRGANTQGVAALKGVDGSCCQCFTQPWIKPDVSTPLCYTPSGLTPRSWHEGISPLMLQQKPYTHFPSFCCCQNPLDPAANTLSITRC